MCKAVDQMTERARREGISYGESKGFRDGKLETLRNDVKNIMESLNMGLDDALNALKVTGEDRILLQKMA